MRHTEIDGYAAPVGGPILTRAFEGMALLVVAGVVVLAWRFYAGLGAMTAMNDGYPWGIWIAYDVVAGTALACGGYAVALLCYVLNAGSITASFVRRSSRARSGIRSPGSRC